jgi:hypothetical protein
VHDGKQRLTSLSDYIAGKFPVTDESLGVYKAAFNDLSTELQETIRQAKIAVKTVKFDGEDEALADFIKINTRGRSARKFDVWFAHRGSSEFVASIIKMAGKYQWSDRLGPLANTEALLSLACFQKNLAADPPKLYAESVRWPVSARDIIYQVFKLRAALELEESFGKFLTTAAAKQALVYLASKKPEANRMSAFREGFHVLRGVLEGQKKSETRRKHATAALIEKLFKDELKLV